MASTSQLSATMKALVLRSTAEPPSVEDLPIPWPTYGTAVIRILAAATTNFMKPVYTGGRPFSIPSPMVPGTSAIGRVVSVGPDCTRAKEGDLVFFDCVIRSRDSPADTYLSAVPFTLSESAKKLREHFGNGSFAEYCRTPLENLHVLNETRLLGDAAHGGLGYKVEQLALAALLLVPFGGLKAVNLQAGETVLVAPATGSFGGCGVLCAQAMGARVIAMGRDEQLLAALKTHVPFPERLHTVQITGNVQDEVAALTEIGGIDALLEIGPPQASRSTHIQSAILALKHGARISFMGGYRDGEASGRRWRRTYVLTIRFA